MTILTQIKTQLLFTTINTKIYFPFEFLSARSKTRTSRTSRTSRTKKLSEVSEFSTERYSVLETSDTSDTSDISDIFCPRRPRCPRRPSFRHGLLHRSKTRTSRKPRTSRTKTVRDVRDVRLVRCFEYTISLSRKIGQLGHFFSRQIRVFQQCFNYLELLGPHRVHFYCCTFIFICFRSPDPPVIKSLF